MSNKIRFSNVLAIVISSQIGSGIFFLPINLAQYGGYSLISWIISSIGALSFAVVFASLCTKFPETGGPHVYIRHAFGFTPAFFIGWTYWVISWVSTTSLIIIGTSHLTIFYSKDIHQNISLFLELLLLVVIILINLRGISFVGRFQLIFTVTKIFVLFIISVSALFFFDINNFIVNKEILNLKISQILANSTLLTLWSFIGVELVTSSVESINDPINTIPKAIISGTVCVAVIYFINNFAIMGLINGNSLSKSKAPYVDAIKIMLSGNWYLFITIIAFIFCFDTLNTWVLSSGQVALGLAKDKIMPKIFAKKNKYGSPFLGIIISSIGTAVLLILTSNNNFARQIELIIDFSVISFLFIYFICSIAFLKVFFKEKKHFKLLIGCIAMIFSCWVIFETPVNILLITSLFISIGIFPYLFWHKKFFVKKLLNGFHLK